MKHWTPRELDALRRLRTGFLTGSAGAADYWQSDDDLALYDATFGARIGWKVDAALRAASALGWRPRSTRVLDWGCGSGIAGRRVLAMWPGFATLAVHDRSGLAMRFAQLQSPICAEVSERVDRDTLLVLSHVLNELAPPALEPQPRVRVELPVAVDARADALRHAGPPDAKGAEADAGFRARGLALAVEGLDEAVDVVAPPVVAALSWLNS